MQKIAEIPRRPKPIEPADSEIYSLAELPAPQIRSAPHPVQETPSPQPRRTGPASAVPSIVLVCLASATLFAWAVDRESLVFKVAAVLMAPICAFAVWRGGIRKTAVLGALLGLSMLTVYCPELLAGVVNSIASQASPITSAIVSLVLAGFVVFLVGMGAKSITRRLIGRSRLRGAINRLAGFAVGTGETALIVLTICWTCESLQPLARRIVEEPGIDRAGLRFQVADAALRIRGEAELRGWGRCVRDTNPISKSVALQRIFDQLSETGRLDFNEETLRSLLPFGASQGLPKDSVKFLEPLIRKQVHSASVTNRAHQQLQESLRP